MSESIKWDLLPTIGQSISVKGSYQYSYPTAKPNNTCVPTSITYDGLLQREWYVIGGTSSIKLLYNGFSNTQSVTTDDPNRFVVSIPTNYYSSSAYVGFTIYLQRNFKTDYSFEISAHFTRYDFSATAGTGIAQAWVTSNCVDGDSYGYDGDEVTFTASLIANATFDGWYNSDGVRVSTSNPYVHTVNGADVTLQARTVRYNFSATAGTGITSANASPSTGYIGDTITFTCVLQSGAEFDGWYNNGTRVSTSQRYTCVVINSSLTLEARGSIPVTSTLSATYNGSLIFSMQTSGSKAITYDGSTITNITSGQRKTLNCKGKVMASNVVVGNKTLQCNGKVMTTNVVIDYGYTDYLCFTAEEANSSVTLIYSGESSSVTQTFYISTNGTAWSPYTLGSEIFLTNVGDKLYWKGNNNVLSTSPDEYFAFSVTGKIGASGNVMSILDATCQLMTVPQLCFINLFEYCSDLTSAPSLPATTIGLACYSNMFLGCTSLTIAPELPALSVQESSYDGMFSGCTSLVVAPNLPATILSGNCYARMFEGCTSLTTVPELPSNGVEMSSYDSMFENCSSLKVYSTARTGADKAWRIPTSGSTGFISSMSNMFYGTIGDYSEASSVTLNTTFYTQNTPV